MKSKHILATGLLSLITFTGLHAQTAAKPGELVNADFIERGANGLPTGWSFTDTGWIIVRGQSVKKQDNVTVTTEQEGSKSIVRLTCKDSRNGCIAQVVELPPRAKEAHFKVSVRGKAEVVNARTTAVVGGFAFFKADGKFLPSPPTKRKLPKELSTKSWEQIEVTATVPPGATCCHVLMGNDNTTNGVFEFRGVSVKFR